MTVATVMVIRVLTFMNMRDEKKETIMTINCSTKLKGVERTEKCVCDNADH